MASASGLLLIGHGTRSAEGREQFLWLTGRLRQRLEPLPVEAAFLELAEPTIDEAVGKLLERGVQRLVTMPLLLFAAGHAKDDVPRAVNDALDRRGMRQIEQRQAAHLGCHSALLALAQLRLCEALRQANCLAKEPNPQATCHLLIGRGSRDETATAEMYEFSCLLSQMTGFATEVAFLAMARPSLADQLTNLSQRSYRRVIVQPHLLFHGDLVASLTRHVAAVRGNCPATEWVIARTLADDPESVGNGTDLLEHAILDRCHAAGLPTR